MGTITKVASWYVSKVVQTERVFAVQISVKERPVSEARIRTTSIHMYKEVGLFVVLIYFIVPRTWSRQFQLQIVRETRLCGFHVRIIGNVHWVITPV